MKISEFFEDVLGANLSNARWSWGAYNPDTDQLFLRVWEDEIEVVDGTEQVAILEETRKAPSPGLPERRRHVDALRQGTDGYGVICTAKDEHTKGVRVISKFDDKALLALGQVVDRGDRVFAIVRARIPVADLARPRTASSSIVPDLKEILSRSVDVTEKEALANARVGQGAFRAKVLALWGRQCCVTGCRTLDVIRASHIKPWRQASNAERLDPLNGLPLVANLDALFDAGLVTFEVDGSLVVSKRLGKAERRLLGLDGLCLIRAPGAETTVYLEYHRNHIFVDARGG